MRLIFAVVLSIIYIFMGYMSYKRTRDLFSPLVFFSAYQFLRYIPNIVLKNEEHNFIITDNSLFLLFFYQILFAIFMFIGYKAFKSNNSINKDNTKKPNLFFVFLLYLIGILSRIVVINKSGGIYDIIYSPGYAYAGLTSGTGYLSLLSYFSVFSIVVFMYYSKENKRLWFILPFMIVLYIFTYIIFSTRSPILELLLLLIFVYNYLFKKIEPKHFFKIKYFILVALMIFILMALPYFRSGQIKSIFNYDSLKTISKDGFTTFFDQFSYVGRDSFVYSHFNIENRWYGQPFLNLLYGPIPANFFSKKPAIDDGIYLNHLLKGFLITPNQGRDSFIVHYSIPFSTQGSMYANFGIVGVIFGGLVVGFLYNKTYKNLENNPSYYNVMLYFLIIYQLELSSLSIVQTLMPIFIYLVSYKILSLFPTYRKGRGVHAKVY